MSHFLLLGWDDQHIAVAQDQVLSLEPILDMVADPPAPNTVGYLPFMHRQVALQCLDGYCQAVAQTPPSRRVCVILGSVDQPQGLLCDDVQVIQNPTTLPFPQAMGGGEQSPWQGLIHHDQQWLAVARWQILLGPDPALLS